MTDDRGTGEGLQVLCGSPGPVPASRRTPTRTERRIVEVRVLRRQLARLAHLDRATDALRALDGQWQASPDPIEFSWPDSPRTNRQPPTGAYLPGVAAQVSA